MGQKKMSNFSLYTCIFPFVISMLPIAELRGGLPLALSQGVSPAHAYLVSVLGNIIPVLPLLVGFKFLTRIAMKYKLPGKILKIIQRKAKKRENFIRRYGIGAIIALVAIPFPVTGAWTGSLISSLLSIPVKYSFPAICAGVCIAGVIVLFATLGIFELGKIFIGM